LPQRSLKALSYFTSSKLARGALVEIMLNNRKVPAIIDTIEPISKQKSILRKSDFTLKRVSGVLSESPMCDPRLFEIAKQLAKYYIEPVGNVLKTFIPAILLKKPKIYTSGKESFDPFQISHTETIIGPFEERAQYYKTLIRETFARGGSIALFVPTIEVANYLYSLCKEFPKLVVLLHSKQTVAAVASIIEKLRNSNEPYLMIGTPLSLGVLRGNESVCIIEDSDSPHYKRYEHPYINLQSAIKEYAHSTQAKCILGKSTLSLDDLKDGIKPNYISSRLTTTPQSVFVDMTKEHDRYFSKYLIDHIEEHTERTILFINRKGYYSFIMCKDCGQIALCLTCKSPITLSLYTKDSYTCNRCQKTYPSTLACNTCHGWNLKGYGVGTNQVYTEIAKRFPKRQVWMFDNDSIKTDLQRKSIKQAFLGSDDGILIGTELILEDPGIKAPFVAAIHIDNLFSIPDFQIHEQVLAILIKLTEKTTSHPIAIQTRLINHPLFQHYSRQDIKQFLSAELEERKQGDLPPHSLFIKLIIENKNVQTLKKQADEIYTLLKPLCPSLLSYPSFARKNQHVFLITVDHKKWMLGEERLRDVLTSFPYQWDIEVDPKSVL
jgi:primosomal protein N'